MDSLLPTANVIAFLTYFGSGLGLLLLAGIVVLFATPHRDLALIRAGNTAAATAFGGVLVGLALPIQAAITHSASLPDALVWGALASLAQIVAYIAARLLVGRLSAKITEGDLAAGVFSAALSISVGLINAAAMTP